MPPMIIYAKSFPGGQYRFDGPEDAISSVYSVGTPFFTQDTSQLY